MYRSRVMRTRRYRSYWTYVVLRVLRDSKVPLAIKEIRRVAGEEEEGGERERAGGVTARVTAVR